MAWIQFALFLVAGLVTISSVDAWEEEPCPGSVTKFPGSGPDLSFNQSCNTGSCKFGGIKSYFHIPLGKGEYGYKQNSYDSKTMPKSVTKAGKVKGNKDIEVIEINGGPAGCCFVCKYYFKCTYWQFVQVGCGKCGAGLCFVYQGNSKPQYVGEKGAIATTAVGAKCQIPECNNDPHLTGAHGTKYDFNGIPGKSFALISDRTLQINMEMVGYYDERTETPSVADNGKMIRTWIRQLGLVWTEEGVEHKLRLVARSGSETNRGEGYLERAELDGEALPKMAVGEEAELAGRLTFGLEAHEKEGPYDVDFYSVKIFGLLNMDVRLRVANPLLQTPEDAFVHISVAFNSLAHTPAVHGVLGQTYQASHETRAEEFSEVSTSSLKPISADGESGKGFLDGKMEDYVVEDVLSTKFPFSAYGSKSQNALGVI